MQSESEVFIGWQPVGGAAQEPIRGWVDDIRIYRELLTAGEISNVFTTGG